MPVIRLIIFLVLLVGYRGLWAQDSLYINEFMASNLHSVMGPDKAGFPDWIEIYNGESTPVDLGGLFLTDDLADPFKWTFPEGAIIEAGSYFIIWADGLIAFDHASFKLSEEGEQIGLFYPDGRVIDSLTFGSQFKDLSYGRDPENKDDWYYFFEPTPWSLNNAPGLMTRDQYEQPAFSVEGGRFNAPFLLTIQADEGTIVHFTLDGSFPNQSSEIYRDGIMVENSMVVCARVYGEDKLPSDKITQSYILYESTGLPVISIACPPEYLFDPEIGITMGNCVRDELGSPPPFDPFANFWKSWERTVHLDYYTPEGYRGLNQEAGIAIFGGYFGRQIRQKAFTLYARDKYGDTDFDFPLFSSRQANSFSRFILRASSNDYIRTFIRDAMMNTLVIGQMDLDYWAYDPAIVYINGEFWGLYNIREKMNRHYAESNYGIEIGNVELVEWKDGRIQGDTRHFLDMLQFIRENDISLPQNYEYVKTLMDTREFMNYFIAEIYVCNHDWLIQNIKCWREAGENGRWRWLLYDLDWGFNGVDPFGTDQAPVNTFQFIMDHGVESAELFKLLIQNQDFRAEFAQRFVTQMNLTFRPERVHSVIDSIAAQIAPEMPRQIERWGAIKSMDYWHDQLSQLNQFAEDRPFHILSHLYETILREEKTQLTLEVSNPEAGFITVFETNVPFQVFSGEWYKYVPIPIEAHSRPGWHFVRWEGSVFSTNDSLSLVLNDPVNLMAVFESIDIASVVISEIHYNPSSELQGSDDDFEFIELYNPGYEMIDLSAYRFSEGIDFTFNQGIFMNPDEIILLAQNPSMYTNSGVRVFQITNGKLSNSGEKLVLMDNLEMVVDIVQYDDHYPWPGEADGDGPSLELIDARLDNNLASSWSASTETGGTPGYGNITGTKMEIINPDDPFNIVISPNPFHNQTRITFSCAEICRVTCNVYNAFGQEVNILVNEIRSPGDYSLDWKPMGLPAGVYFVHYTAGSSRCSETVLYLGDWQ